MSILASRHVRGAVGVDSVCSAVTDARNNALANGVHNVEFIPGLAEKVNCGNIKCECQFVSISVC